jgi:hypothetical protein
MIASTTIPESRLLQQPARYQIDVSGELDSRHTLDSGSKLQLSVPQAGCTRIEGLLDQAALFGLLRQLRDLGLPLLCVRYLDSTLKENSL